MSTQWGEGLQEEPAGAEAPTRADVVTSEVAVSRWGAQILSSLLLKQLIVNI